MKEVVAMKFFSRNVFGWVNRRWIAPVAIAAISVSALNISPSMASADSTPTLPPITANQLLQNALQAKVDGVSGDVKTVANLGLPNLGNYMNNVSPWMMFLTGTQHVKVWSDSSGNGRVQIPTYNGETDLVKNANGGWLWQSANQQVIHATAPADGEQSAMETNMLSPQLAAQQLLNAVQPTTTVSIDTTASVAGHAAYQLVLTPNASQSLVQDVRIAFDSKTFVPLRVQIFAKGQISVAYEVAFTTVHFTTPKSSVFAFKAPKGATVKTLSNDHADNATKNEDDKTTQPLITGTAWQTVAVFQTNNMNTTTDRRGPMQELLKTAQPISGPFGSGKLFHTALVNVALLDDGRVAVGSVQQDSLVAAIPAR